MSGDAHVENTKEILMNNGGELVKEIRNKNPNFIKIRDNRGEVLDEHRVENTNIEGYQCLDLDITSPMFSDENNEDLFLIS